MKLNSILGKGTGKLGNMVFAVVNGQQIVRELRTSISNPSTSAQVNQRARLKLMSQLAAAIAPVIAYARDGGQSPRNLFIKNNIRYCYVSGGVAQITLENIQLTNGSAGLPQIAAERSAEDGLIVHLAEAADASVAAVIYCVYKKNSESYLQLIGTTAVSDAGDDGDFPATFDYTTGELIIWAYALKAITPDAKAAFANLSINTGVDVAVLTANRTLNAEEYQYTQTRGATMGVNDTEIVPVPDGSARVYVTALTGGTASGAGTFVIGTSVTVTATPSTGYKFKGWKVNGGTTYVSTSASYTFTLAQTTDLVAEFEEDEGNPN